MEDFSSPEESPHPKIDDSASPDEGRKAAESTSVAARPRREVKPPEYLKDYVALAVEENYEHFCFNTAFEEHIPSTYTQAMSSPQSAEWEAAMKDEISSIKENDTYDLVELP